MAIILSVINQKGGCSKTTIIGSIYGVLKKQGLTVALIDCDLQNSLSNLIEGAEVYGLDDMEELRSYDAILIDTPPYRSNEIQKVIDISNFVLIPCKPSKVDLLASIPIANSIKGRVNTAVVVTMAVHGSSLTSNIKEAFKNNDIAALDTVVYNRSDYARIFYYDNTVYGTKNTKLIQEAEALTTEILKKL